MDNKLVKDSLKVYCNWGNMIITAESYQRT